MMCMMQIYVTLLATIGTLSIWRRLCPTDGDLCMIDYG